MELFEGMMADEHPVTWDDIEKISGQDEINETSEETEGLDVEEAIESEIRTDVPDVEEAIVYGDPEQTGADLDWVQGDAVDYALGTCGLTSAANISQMAGLDITEEMTVEYAMENELCTYEAGSPENTGGMGTESMETLLEEFCGLEVHTETWETYDLEDIAQDVISGRGVIVGLSAGVIWDEPSMVQTRFGETVADHYVTVTGVAVDAETGEVAGLYVCDSGNRTSCEYISAETFDEAFEECLTADVVITDDPIRS